MINARNLFQTRGVVKERAIRIIIDGESCNMGYLLDGINQYMSSLDTHEKDKGGRMIWARRRR
jgi:hypothetical protein